MTIDDLLGSVKKKVGAGVLGLGLVLGSYGGMGCGGEDDSNKKYIDYTDEEFCRFLEKLCPQEPISYDKCMEFSKEYPNDKGCHRCFDSLGRSPTCADVHSGGICASPC